jgi:hypothetical protein
VRDPACDDELLQSCELTPRSLLLARRAADDEQRERGGAREAVAEVREARQCRVAPRRERIVARLRHVHAERRHGESDQDAAGDEAGDDRAAEHRVDDPRPERRDGAVGPQVRQERTLGRLPGVQTAVAGDTAEDVDFTHQMKRGMPYVIAFVLAFAFIVLLVAFRSLVVPVKAIVLNLLSVGAAYGVLVLVFQHRWAEPILGFRSDGAIISWLPLFLFVRLFGLSMDYHVFILSRVREAVDNGAATDTAVRYGITVTAGVVTSAALVMVGVFSIFGTLSSLEIKQAGVGLAAAVLIDATRHAAAPAGSGAAAAGGSRAAGPRARVEGGREGRLPRRARLRQALTAVPLLVLLTPLRLILLRLGELLVGSRPCVRVFARRVLAGHCPATCGHEGDDQQRYGNRGKDDPRQHASTLLRHHDARSQRPVWPMQRALVNVDSLRRLQGGSDGTRRDRRRRC